MKIKKILSQHRRDFRAIFNCEHCGFEKTMSGYDDAHYHNNMIRMFSCDKCGKTANDEYRPLATKYPEGYQI